MLCGRKTCSMIITVTPNADLERLRRDFAARGLWTVRHDDGRGATVFFVLPHSASSDPEELRQLPGVATVTIAASEHPLIDDQRGIVEVAGVTFGSGHPAVWLAGPCSVESEESIDAVARRLAQVGVRFLRGGAFKPRTSPYAFQGNGEPALGWLAAAARRHDLRVVTEALSEATVEVVAGHADLIQVGSRNMHNFALLRGVARARKPVLLKRGMAATIEEWLAAGEYLRLHGAPAVLFCERGIRSFDAMTRNLLDLSAVALLTHQYRLPVIVDPSHAAGRRDLVAPLTRAALAAGACGVMIETHDDPGRALSDGPQALTATDFERLIDTLGPLPSLP